MRISAPRARLCFFAFISSLSLGGCGVALPNLSPVAGSQPDPNNPYSISINEVVKRVKCEVWLSIKDRPEKLYPWFNKWTVQADLTLTVNDSSSINPGATFIEPLRVVSTSRSLGIGGGLTNTVFRTEIVSFSMSVADMRREFDKPTAAMMADYNWCGPYAATDLTGKLGLVEWVNSAFGPIDNHLLREGIHGAPKAPNGTQGGAPPSPHGLAAEDFHKLLKDATASPSPPATPDSFPPNLSKSIRRIYAEYNLLIDALKFTGTALEDISGKKGSDDYFKELAGDLDKQIAEAKTEGASPAVTSILDNYRKRVASDISPPIGNDEGRLQKLVADSQIFLGALAEKVTQELAPAIPMVQLQCDCYPDNGHADQGAKVLKCLTSIQSLAKLLTPAKPTKNPPIDAISHQVNFVVMFSGSVNPTWTLVRFKGPSPSSGNFATMSESNTHNLTIVMGAPGSPAAANARSALTLSSSLATQLAPQLGTTPSIVP